MTCFVTPRAHDAFSPRQCSSRSPFNYLIMTPIQFGEYQAVQRLTGSSNPLSLLPGQKERGQEHSQGLALTYASTPL